MVLELAASFSEKCDQPMEFASGRVFRPVFRSNRVVSAVSGDVHRVEETVPDFTI